MEELEVVLVEADEDEDDDTGGPDNRDEVEVLLEILTLFLRSALLTQLRLLAAQKAQGLPPSHLVFRRRQVSQADPELRRRAVLVVKTPLGCSDTTL